MEKNKNNKNNEFDNLYKDLSSMLENNNKNTNQKETKIYKFNNTPDHTREENEQYNTEELIEYFTSKENVKNEINKSCKVIPIKKQTNKIIIKKEIIKKIITALVVSAAIITVAKAATTIPIVQEKIIEPIEIHFETEEIRKECVETFYEKLTKTGINPNDYTVEGLINNCAPELLEENIFEMYLIIEEEEFNILESVALKDKLIKKIGYGESFSKYIINEGYFEHSYSSSGETIMATYADYRAWENAMEAQKLAEKQAQNNMVRKG